MTLSAPCNEEEILYFHKCVNKGVIFASDVLDPLEGGESRKQQVGG